MKRQMVAIGLAVLASSGCTPVASKHVVSVVDTLPGHVRAKAAAVESDAEDRAWDSDEPRVIKREWDVELVRGNAWLLSQPIPAGMRRPWCDQGPTCEVKPRGRVFVEDTKHLEEQGFVDWLNREGIAFWSNSYDEVVQRELLEKPAARKLHGVRLANTTADADLTQVVSAMPQLRLLDLGATKVSDAGMAEVSKLGQLRELNLTFTKVSDVGLAAVSKLSHLRELNLSGTQVSDAGMTEVSKLSQLRELSLFGTKVSDVGLAKVSKLGQLRVLNLASTKVTAGGCSRLRSQLPSAQVFCG